MDRTILAIFDAGVFRPLESVNLAEGTRAEVIPLSPVASSSSASACQVAWPPGYFEQTAGALAGEEFERAPQGTLRPRDAW